MEKEILIKNLDGRIDKPSYIKSQTEKSFNKKNKVIDPNNNLSQQMYDNSSSLYLNPTEKLKTFTFVRKGDVTATVLSSGDFAFDSIFKGSEEVLTFDINKNQYYPASLKLKALQVLPYDEFWDFFSNVESLNHLSKETYEKIKRLSQKSPNLYAFFDVIMNQREIDQKNLNRTLKLLNFSMDSFMQYFKELMPNDLDRSKFSTEAFVDEILKSIYPGYKGSKVLDIIVGKGSTKEKDNYLENEKSYNETKGLIKSSNIYFVKSDISKLKIRLDSLGYTKNSNFSGFNSIYLSNIPEFITGEEFEYLVDSQLMPLLTSDGVMVYCCQCTSKETLCMDDRKLKSVKSNRKITDGLINPLASYQIVNSVEGFRAMNKQYNVDVIEDKTYGSINGYDDVDSYVYVKKRKKL